MNIPVIYKDWSGGWSIDPKIGIKHSFAFSQALDFRKSPSQLTVLPGPTREDNGVVTDLIQNEVMTDTGLIYALGSSSNFYRRTTAGVWSNEANIDTVGCFGMDYRKDTDAIYVCGTKTVSLYNNVSGTNGASAMFPGFYSSSVATVNTVDTINGATVNPNQSGSGQTYTLGTTISENITNLRYFQSDIEPLNKISLFVVTKGTGDWTLTLHDGLNNVLGTATVTNANLVNNAFNDFVFTSATNAQVRIYVAPNARTYHFHVTSTVADGTISCSTGGDCSTCDVQVYADRLVVTNNGMHPMARFLQYEVIGNGNYLSVWEPLSDPPTNAEWLRHRLVFPMTYESCGVATTNEFVVIALEKTTTGTSTPQEGLLAFWDGTSPSYNYFIRIPEGSPYALHEYKNVVYYYAGGAWWAIGSPTTQPTKIRTMPGVHTEYSGAAVPLVVNPYAATVRRGIHLMGWPSTTTATDINFGVYSWGSIDKNIPDSFGYSYVLSTGSQNYSVSNNLTIGMVKNFGDTLHISWRDTTHGGYGIDVVTNASAPASFAAWQSLIFDNGVISKTKTGYYVKVTVAGTFPSDCYFYIKYKINRGDWVTSNAIHDTDLISNTARFDITSPSRFNEIQWAIDVYAGTTTPVYTSAMLVFESNSDESDF